MKEGYPEEEDDVFEEGVDRRKEQADQEEEEEMEQPAAEEEPQDEPAEGGEAEQEEPQIESKVDTLFVAIPLLTKGSREVLEQTKMLVTKLRQKGLVIHRLHTDLGKEFITAGMKRFCSNQGLRKTCTTGSEPQANGRAECAVGIVKRGARKLTRSALLDK